MRICKNKDRDKDETPNECSEINDNCNEIYQVPKS